MEVSLQISACRVNLCSKTNLLVNRRVYGHLKKTVIRVDIDSYYSQVVGFSEVAGSHLDLSECVRGLVNSCLVTLYMDS